MKQMKKFLYIFIVALFVISGVLVNVTAKAAVVQAVPTISYVGLGHTLVAGDTRSFTVTSAKYVGNVQYKAFLYDGVKWKELTLGYTKSVDGKTVVVLPTTSPFRLGNYRLSIWVKKAGTVGINKNASGLGSYDSYKIVSLNCVNTVGATISNANIVREHNILEVGNTERFKVTSNYTGKVQYKAYLIHGDKSIELSTGYSVAVDSKTPYGLPETPVFELGAYKLSVWVKRAGEVGVKTNSSGLGSYDNYTVIDLNCVNGSFIGNANNEGNFVLNKDWVYTNTIDSDYIFKMKSDGTQKKMLNLQASAYLNVTENYIFYVNKQDHYRLYRMNTDGSNILCINAKDSILNLVVYNDNIYYSNGNDNGKIYSIKFDGSYRTKISNQPGGEYVNISGNCLYYSASIATGGSGPLYRVNLDGTSEKLINGDSCSYEILKNGVFYFINASDNNHLYKMNIDGTNCKKLNDDECGYLNISDNVLYYTNGDDNAKIYAIKTDGTLRAPVTTESAYYLNIAGDKIYYKTQQVNGEEHSTNLINLNTNEIPNDPSSLGNIPGNINNEAFAATDGKYLYMHDANVGGLYRYNVDYTNKFDVRTGTHDVVNYLNVSNGWLYYADMSTHTIAGAHIYKIKADGSGQRIELSSNRAFYMTVSGEWIYYTTVEADSSYTGGGLIHKVRIDGTGETYVDFKDLDYAANIDVVGDYIYYLNIKDNMTIYKVKIDGTGREKVLDEPARGLNVMDGYIYFNSDFNGKLKRIPIGGGTPVILNDNNVYENFIVTSNKIYYVNMTSIYSSNLDGSSETFITNCTIGSQINVACNYLYYKDDSGKMNVIKVQ